MAEPGAEASTGGAKVRPTVSVVIPACNAAAWLGRALDSVLGQTVRPDEVVVVDDGSEDGTGELARSYGEPVRVVTHGRPRGLVAARNTGIAEATGEWGALLDAETVWYPAKLARQLGVVTTAPAHVGMVFCLTRMVGADGGWWVDGAAVPDPGRDWEAFRRALLMRNAVTGSSCSPLIRRSAFLQVGGYDESLRTCSDWDLWLRLAEVAEFRRLDEVLCEERVHTAGASAQLEWILEEAAVVLGRALPRFIAEEGEREALRLQALELIRGHAAEAGRSAA